MEMWYLHSHPLWIPAMLNSLKSYRNTEMELKMWLSLSMMQQASTRKQSREEQNQWKNQLYSKMNMGKWWYQVSKHLAIQSTPLLKEESMMDHSCQGTTDIIWKRSLMRSLQNLNSKWLIILLEISQIWRWSLLRNGMRECLIFIGTGQLTTQLCTLSTPRLDQPLWLITMK